ncbi:MAG: purine-nucleoside phosphorylase [Acidobacteriaceae bacterium]|nr:purine-nucleoside phosphorylase [Acidobacteriaceae bacterium]
MSAPADNFTRAETAAEFVRTRTALRPRIGVVLGSGLGAFADSLADRVCISYGEIPGFPVSTAIGHAGRLVIGSQAGVPLAVMQGRVHLYEGYSGAEVVFPMRVLKRLGVKAAILTNAAGGINLEYKQGALVVLADHINLQGTNPLVGPNDDRFGVRFPDMTFGYHRPYREKALEEGRRLGLTMYSGVYAAMLGPSYETPAEIRFLRTIGADVVGMSTVAEAIAARHMQMKVLAISCVTNMAAGILDKTLTAEEVFETTARVQGEFTALLRAVIPRMEAEL